MTSKVVITDNFGAGRDMCPIRNVCRFGILRIIRVGKQFSNVWGGVANPAPLRQFNQEASMPTISMFYGILVSMYLLDTQKHLRRISRRDGICNPVPTV